MLATLSFLTPLTLAVIGGFALALLGVFALLRLVAGPPAAVARRAGLLTLRALAIATLALIILNPSDVTETPGPIDRPDLFYLLDASQSMAFGDEETRFEHARRLMREAETSIGDDPHADVKLFRFGHRLAAVDQQKTADSNQTQPDAKAPSVDKKKTNEKPLEPVDSDTQLVTALRQASSRFGRRPPAGIVVFSDGRSRDESGVEQVAAQFAKLKVPVHVVPVGDTSKGGDVAVVAVVVPARVRRYTSVDVQIFLRSYGFEGRRCEVSLVEPGSSDGSGERPLAPVLPVTLHDGFQSVELSFRTEPKTRKLKVKVSSLPNEVSATNNEFATQVMIDRTKIRVLYIEGSSQPLQPVQRGTKYEVRGPYSDIQNALTEDEDIECVVLHAQAGRTRLQRVGENSQFGTVRGFPETVAELAAFDALILSDVAANSFTDQQLEWIEQWIGQRGGGLVMVGGQKSFSAGNWDETPIASMLPIELREDNDWLPGTQVSVKADATALNHPLWMLTSNAVQNREIVSQFPAFFGANRWGAVKPNLTRVIANSNLAAAEPPPTLAVVQPAKQRPGLFDQLRKNLLGPNGSTKKPDDPKQATAANVATGSSTASSEPLPTNTPAIVSGQYGRGRTLVMAMPVTSPWANDFLNKWGDGDTRYFGKFWRNSIYWLTESSSIGRRRLVVTADKKFYRPGETITLTAAAFDESATPTGSYKITSMVEPQASLTDLESNYSPIRWPEGKPRESGESGPFVAWGEEFDLPRVDTAAGKPAFQLALPIADALTVGSASQSLRVELTAMEEFTQVDSTSLDIQVLHDPFEQQNPFPNHELLTSIARHSGGQVITEASQLATVLRDVPLKAGTPVVKKTPLWPNWWLWTWMLGLLTVEWVWRRFVGLA